MCGNRIEEDCWNDDGQHPHVLWHYLNLGVHKQLQMVLVYEV